MMHYGHGGDVVGFEQKYGRPPLDFSANTNPLGISPLARQAIQTVLHTADRYPDPHCRRLCSALAGHEGVDAKRIVCGNGAADLIFRMVHSVRPATALLTAPTFSEYAQALAMYGCKIRQHRLSPNNGFALTEAILDDITPDVNMMFLCNPNNPTGVASPPELMKEIVLRCAQTSTLLVVDECFNGFLPDPKANSCVKYLDGQTNLTILKAFTKLYGMAGVRLGYALCGNEIFAADIWQSSPPWMVSSLAQAAGEAALGDREYVRQTLDMLAAERPRVKAALIGMGFEVYPSQANYLLLYTRNCELHVLLAERGIMIRDCSNYPGLGAGYYRVALRTPEENDILLQTMGEIA